MRISDWSSDVCSSDLGSSEDAPPDYRLRSRLYGKGNDLSLAVELVQADNDLVVWTHEVPIRAAARGPDQLARVSMSLASSLTSLRGPVVERDRKSTRMNSSH